MDLAKEKNDEIIMPEDPNKIVQMPVRIDAKTRNELKIFAINEGKTLNELLVKYVKEGFEKDRKSKKSDSE